MKKRIYGRLFSIVTAAVMLFNFVKADVTVGESSNDIMSLALTDGVDDKAADASTKDDWHSKDDWKSIFDLENSSRYAGKVWADKTVEIGEDNDFAHTFSLLGSGLKENRSGLATPLDVVFVLDTSYSMAAWQTKRFGYTSLSDVEPERFGGKKGNQRIIKSAEALNLAVGMLMDSTQEGVSPYNRVGLVTFDTTADIVLDLGRYQPGAGNFNYSTSPNYFEPGQNNMGTNWNPRYQAVNDFMDVNADPVAGSDGVRHTNKIEPKIPIDSTSASYYNHIYGYTNTQAGIYEGMNMLATASDTTFWVNEKGETSSTEQPGWTKLERRPIVILLSDGVPTRMCSDTNWWEPVTNDTNRVYGEKENNAYPELSFMSMATGSYMKQIVDNNYDNETPKVFTLGLELPKLNNGILGNGISQAEVDLGPITLDPSRLYDGSSTSTNMEGTIRGYMDNYTTSESIPIYTHKRPNGTSTPSISESIDRYPFDNATYTMYHPDTGIDIDDLNYVDKYYDVSDAIYLEGYFQEIVDGVLKEAKPIPIPIAGMNAADDEDVITYTDPIGLYMEVKSVDSLELFGKTYPITYDHEEGNKTYYTAGSGLIFNPAYGNEPETLNKDDLGVFDLSDIKIWVDDSGDYNDEGGHLADAGFKQALYVQIPAEAMPLHWAELDFDSSNKLTEYKYDTDQMPLRITYDVGIADKYLTGGKVDLNKISPEYKNANTKDGKVYFYSNYFSDTKYKDYTDGDEVSRGDAVVTFSPSEANRYYVFQGSPKVYECGYSGNTRPPELSDVSGLTETTVTDDDAWYYIIIDYYTKENKEHKQVAVARKGSELSNGQRVGDMSGGVKEKESNITGTADTYYLPVISGEGSNATISVYCGNNGYLSVGESLLMLTKELETIYLPNAGEEEFGFTITSNKLNGVYTAIVVNYNYAADTWQNKISGFKLQTDNEGNLLRKDGSKSDIILPDAAGKGSFNAVEEGKPASGFNMVTYITEEKYYRLPEHLRSKYKITPNEEKAGITEICYGNTVLATISPDDSIVSDYVTESTYETKNVTFADHKADVSLKGGEGLLFSLDSGTDITITEDLTPEQKEANYRLKTIQHTGGENVAVTLKEYKTEGETDAKELLHINYINSKFYKTQTSINGKDVSLEEKENGLLIGPAVNEGMDITYNIGWANDAIESEHGTAIAADVTITDTLDEGVDFSGAAFASTDAIIAYPGADWIASGGDGAKTYTCTKDGKTILYDEKAHTVTWKFNAKAQESGKVALQVTVNEKAAEKATEKVENRAAIEVENGSTIDTNYVENPVLTYDLTISKTVNGSGGDKNAEWTFTIKLTLPEGAELTNLSYTGTGGKKDGTLELTKGTDGNYTAEITLKHGQSITLENIPKGTKYTITENEANQKGYKTTVTAHGTISENGVISMLEADETVAFENSCDTGRLEIEKEVADFDSSVDTEGFTFDVTLYNVPQTDLSVEYNYTKTDEEYGTLTFEKAADGTYTAKITLKHGEKITIYDIQYGTAFKVAENDIEGYNIKDITVSGSVTSNKSNGTAEGSVTSDSPFADVKYINERKAADRPTAELPETGGSGVKWIYCSGAGIIMMSLALLYVNEKRRKRTINQQ